MSVTVIDRATPALAGMVSGLRDSGLRPVYHELGASAMEFSVNAVAGGGNGLEPWPDGRTPSWYPGPLRAETGRGGLTIRGTHPWVAAYYRGFTARHRSREVEASEGKALYWPGAAHPVKRVRIPAYTRVVPGRPFFPAGGTGVSPQFDAVSRGHMRKHMQTAAGRR